MANKIQVGTRYREVTRRGNHALREFLVTHINNYTCTATIVMHEREGTRWLSWVERQELLVEQSKPLTKEDHKQSNLGIQFNICIENLLKIKAGNKISTKKIFMILWIFFKLIFLNFKNG